MTAIRLSSRALSGMIAGAILATPAWGQFVSCSSGPTGSVCLSPTTGNVGIGTTPGSNILQVDRSQHGVTRVLVSNSDTTTGDFGTQTQVELQVAGNVIGGMKTTATNLGGLGTPSLYLTTEGAYPVVFGTNQSPFPTMAVGATGGGISLGNGYVSTDPGNGSLIMTGKLGIGTANPQSALAVNGTITSKEVVVTSTGWSDYVFSPGYKLAPLSEVSAYVQENHHLPDIPSAADVAEKGISLGDMQAKLLAKVEELTLHMIESEERSKRLETENAELQRQAAEMRQRMEKLEAGAAGVK